MNIKPQNLRFAWNNLPEGWVLTELRDVLEVHYGKGLTKSVRNETGTVPVYGSNGKVGYHDEALVTGPCIIIGRKGAAGAVHFSAENCWPIDTTYYARPPDELSVKYMFYLLGSLNLEELDRSTAIPGLNRDDLYAQQVPIPPLPEQHLIVAEIETQFTRLDAGVAAMKRVQAKLRRYKASVLKAACEGRLVATEAELARVEGRAYESGSALLARILAERRVQWQQANPGKRYVEPKGPDADGLAALPEGWVWATAEQLGEVIGGLTKNQKRNALKLHLPYLRVANVYANELRLDDLQTVGVREDELDRLLLQEDDLLVVEGNGSLEQIGRVALWNGSVDPCIHQNHVIKVRFLRREIAPFVLYWLLSEGGREQITLVASSTSGLYTLSLSKVSALVIPVPPLTEQHRIVGEVERRLSVAQEVESTVAANLKRAERLRQSILKQAFAGRLVTPRVGA